VVAIGFERVSKVFRDGTEAVREFSLEIADGELMVDDVPPPWQPRGVEVRGRARPSDEGGQAIHPDFPPACLRITPHKILSWGVERPRDRTDPRERRARVVREEPLRG